jgi:2-C-methyl-D-erythritol 4-phosphate cytidylyltransferase/2-C-methyl-D-erythritol 2,4-cyclodiphosphate synthase
MEHGMRTAALIVAAGRGSRAGSADGPKQYRPILGRPLLMRSLEPFLAHVGIDVVRVVIHGDDGELYGEAVRNIQSAKLLPPVSGGATRQASVMLGLKSLVGSRLQRVLIHDAARPLLSAPVLDRVMAALSRAEGAIAAVPLADTLKREGTSHRIASTISRTGLWRAQTPQGFHFDAILAAHSRAAAENGLDFTDDAAVAEWAGLGVELVEGEERNIKVTTPHDFALAQALIEAEGPKLESRTGTGFDVHRFAPGDHVWLCGVRIPHEMCLEGHSDADVALHALTDAILGAIGEGDIGQHFPPSDPRWRGAASRLFLEDAASRVRARGGYVVNVDITLLCEAPRIGPHREQMRNAVADIVGIDSSRVGVKATTTEGLGFTGRREGIAAMASATVLMPR